MLRDDLKKTECVNQSGGDDLAAASVRRSFRSFQNRLRPIALINNFAYYVREDGYLRGLSPEGLLPEIPARRSALAVRPGAAGPPRTRSGQTAAPTTAELLTP